MFFIPIIPLLICCILSMSSLLSCGNRIPYVKDYLPMILSSSGSCISVCSVLCIILTLATLFGVFSVAKTIVS